MEKRFALFLTYCFHPLLIPTYGMATLCWIFAGPYFIQDYRVPLLLISITLVTTGILPALSAWLLLRSGLLQSIQMDDRRERLLPYLSTALYYLLAYYMLKNFPVPLVMLRIIRLFILGASAAILLTACINIFWKISAHTVASGGWCGSLTGLSLMLYAPPYYFLFSVFLITGLVGFARLKLEAHSPAQVYAGFLLGFFCTFFLLYFI